MRRLGLGAAALLVAAGCDNGGTTDTAISMHFDAGPEGGVEVILDGGGAPATPPDGAKACPAGVCNYQTGAGCPASTPACIPASSSSGIAPACTPTTGTGKTGSACTQQGDCAAGWFCAEGQCRKMCCGGDWTGCDSPSEHCIETLAYADDMDGVKATGAMLCYPVGTCNPLQPTGCTQPGTFCLIADATGAAACLPAGTGGTGAPCPCQGGFVCVSDMEGAPPTCHRLCGAVEGGAPPYCQDAEGICVHRTRDPAGVGECSNL
jgi:hypothetical protein